MPGFDLTLVLYGAATTAALIGTCCAWIRSEHDSTIAAILGAFVITGCCLVMFCASVAAAEFVEIVTQ